MTKLGQFYLIAAIIIVMAIVGLASVTNYITTEKKPVKFYDLGDELNLESAEVIDYGIYKQEEISLLMKNFTDNFAQYSKGKEKNVDLVFVYGNEENITITIYNPQTTGEVGVSYGGKNFTISGGESSEPISESFVPEGSEVHVEILNNTYNFNLKSGENFFFVIMKIEKETYIVKSD